jgi:hypothetical protein
MDPDRPLENPDLDNPYAPPQSAFEADTVAYPEDIDIPFDVAQIFHWTWTLFKERMWPCMYIFWGGFAINYGVGFLGQTIEDSLVAANPGAVDLVRPLDVAVTLVISVWVTIGMNMGLLRIARRQPVSFGVIFAGGRRLLSMIVAAAAMTIIVVLVIAVPATMLFGLVSALRRQTSVALLGFVVAGASLAVLALYLMARLLQFYFIVIDRRAGPFASLRLSWEWTRGRAGTIVVVYLLQIVLNLAGLLALCVGLIFTMPLSSLLPVVTYLSLAGTQEQPQRRNALAEPWEEDL